MNQATIMLNVDVQDEVDGRCLVALDRWMIERDQTPLRRDSADPEIWPGTGTPQAFLYRATYGTLDLDAFMSEAAAQPWTMPSSLQLFAMGEDDDRFAVYLLDHGVWMRICDGKNG